MAHVKRLVHIRDILTWLLGSRIEKTELRIQRTAANVNQYEAKMRALSDADFPAYTQRLKTQYAAGAG